MKKNLKKTLCLLVAMILIVTALPMQSLAVFDKLSLSVERVEFSDNLPVSNKLIQRESKVNDYPINITWFVNSDYQYKFDIYLSDGSVVEDVAYVEYLKDLRFVTCAYVDAQECAKAIENGEDTVSAEVVVDVQQGFLGIKNFSSTVEVPIVDEIVSEINLVGDFPENYDPYDPGSAFVGKKFEIRYADGTTKTAAVEDETYRYTLDGELISFSYETKRDYDEDEEVYIEGLYTSYIDFSEVYDAKEIPCNFTDISIVDYVISDDAQLVSLTYCLTHKDGTKVENKCDFEPLPPQSYTGTVIDTVEGTDIVLGYSSMTGGFSYNGIFYISVKAGPDVMGLYASETIDATDYCNCICHKKGLWYTVSFIWHRLICSNLEIQEICDCGSYHW